MNFHMQIELPINLFDKFSPRYRLPRMRRKVIAEEGAKRAEDRRQAILDQQEEGRGWEGWLNANIFMIPER